MPIIEPEALRFLRAVEATQHRIEVATRPLRETLASLQRGQTFLEELEASHRRLEEAWRHLQEGVDRYQRLMVSLGWPPPGDIPISLGGQLAQLYEAGKATPREVERVILDFYCAPTVERLYDKWAERRWLKRRLPIMRAVVDAHNRGEYWLSIPAILPQIEGLIADAFDHRGRLYGGTVDLYAQQILSGGRRSLQAVERFFVEVVRQSAEFGQVPISEVSRHAILHGIDTQYGTAANSLKLLLLWDYLQDAVRFVAIQGRTRFHDPACARIRRSQRVRRLFQLRSHAEDAGLRPCRICVHGT